MKRQNLLVAVLGTSLMLVFAWAAVAAPREAKSAADEVQEEQSLIARECKLSGEQQTALAERFKLKQAALEAWDKANADKLKAAEEAAKTARQGTDEAAKRKAGSDMRTLKTERTQSAAEADKAILAVLTEQQRITFEGVKLAESTLPRYRKANLTDDQVTKVKAACAIAAKDLSGFPGDDKKDKQGRTTIQKSLKWAIDNVILTPEQRAVIAPAKPAAPK